MAISTSQRPQTPSVRPDRDRAVSGARRRRRRDSLIAVLFLAPAVTFYGFAVVYPALSSLRLSFQRWDGISLTRQNAGVSNYTYLFTHDPVFWKAAGNTVIWTLLFVPVSQCIGLLLALLLHRRFRGRTVLRALFYLPFVLSSVSVGLMWKWMYYPVIGFLDTAMRTVHISHQVGWLSDPKIALYSVIAAACWQASGGAMVIFMAGLSTIPDELHESARVDGASELRLLRYITLPLLRESFIIAVSLAVIGSLNVFDIVYAMTLGGPANSSQVLGTWMYFHTFQFQNFGVGAALSWILVIMVAVIAIPFMSRVARSSNV